MTYKFGSRTEGVEDRLNEFLELVRRYDETNGTDPVPDQVKKACIISNMLEPLKTHLQLNVSNVGTFDALRVATEDYLRSRRIFKTTSAGNTQGDDLMEVDVLSRKGKGKGKSGKGKKGGKKGEESHSGKGHGESKIEHTRFDGECRNCGKYGHKAADSWYKQQHKSHGKGTGKSKSNVTEISESDTSKEVEETWPPNTSSQPSSLPQVNTIGEIGRTDEELWIFSVEDSSIRRHSVSWKVKPHRRVSETCEQGQVHELVIDSGCYGHVCPPWFAPQSPLVGCPNIESVTANNATLRHYGREVVYGHVTTNRGRQILIQITFDVMSVRKPLLGTSALKRRGVTIIFNHDYDRILFRNETVNLISLDCHSYLHLTLADGIPRRKAVVTTGENVSIDVDEEVYAADGNEISEAREASDGDRRAIADADQAMQLAISGETRAARALRTPEPPTDAARMLHNRTHVPYRDWCPFCVASRGRSSPHRKIVVNKTADTLPKFQADYMFIRTVAEGKSQPCITFVETRSGAVISFMCARKGGYELTKEILRQF